VVVPIVPADEDDWLVADVAGNLSTAARDTPRMPEQISAPRTDHAGLDELEPLWIQLHSHHRAVSDYQALVEDLSVSWERRRSWYRHLLDEGATYLTATDDGRVVGYAMVTFVTEADDTFESAQGIPELVTLVVAEGHRSSGLGGRLLGAAEQVARDRGFDAMKVAVMAGNSRAQAFYEAAGYSVAELLMYRLLSPLSAERNP
jgi:GNAT superfamily N-acetyltransferase